MNGVPDGGVLRQRAAIVRAIREWFWDNGFIEIEAPTLVRSPALEEHLEAFPAAGAWLHTSPEFALKRVLAAGLPRVFSITPCYRGDEWGPNHGAEFTMVEWYRAGTDYRGTMDDCEGLLGAAAAALGLALPPVQRLSFTEAFLRHTGAPPPEDDPLRTWVNDVEPRLLAPTFVADWPASMSAFSTVRGEICERFELYWRGLELGNAFTELLDPAELLERHAAMVQARTAAGRLPYPLDPRLVDAVARHPRAGGMAVGLDRLVMALTGADDIAKVRVQG